MKAFVIEPISNTVSGEPSNRVSPAWVTARCGASAGACVTDCRRGRSLHAWSSASAWSRSASRDLARARAFYEALGWTTGAAPGDDVAFFQAGGMVVALWDRATLAEDSGVEDGGGWGGVTLAHNVRSPEEVDAVTEEARAAGADDRPRARRDVLGRLLGRLHGP